MNLKPKVAVAMSGGIDSSMTIFLLQKKGYDCFGIHLKLWHDAQKIPSLELSNAKKVAKKFNIPFYVYDLTKTYKKKVIDYYLHGYQTCKTPNPCVKCNKYIKFGLLLSKAKKLGADYLATGHYVRLKKLNGKYHLYMAKDLKKDQSYFLYTLTQNQLKHLFFPVGNYNKEEIRTLANNAGLPELNVIPESQDACFLTETTHHDFLKKNLKGVSGPIKTVSGHILGQHEGLFFYTVGQRKGIKIGGGGPWYVKKLDYKTNTLIVGKKEDLLQDRLKVKNISFISGITPKLPLKIVAKIRYQAVAKPVILDKIGKRFVVQFLEPENAITPGQSVVFYHGKELIGGGVIC